MKLISNTLFGDYLRSRKEEFKTRLPYLEWYYKLRYKYDKFLSQPLKLEMFVPCDEDGNVLDESYDSEPVLEDYIIEILNTERGYTYNDGYDMKTYEEDVKLSKKYQKAKERCLFKGFETFTIEEIIMQLCEYHHEGDLQNFSIEDLYNCWFDSEIKLTPTAIKQIGL